MRRRSFLTNLALIPFAGISMKLEDLNKLVSSIDSTGTIPALFVGHGSPMNAVEDNVFSRKWAEIGKILPKPKAILSVSAHWETKGVHVTTMKHPKTIHDFGGFPRELYEVEYPASGSPELASETTDLLRPVEVLSDQSWGLDHGTWSVLKRMYPLADVPVFQLSLDYTRSPESHYLLAKELKPLREKGVLILGSGNLVHNLRMVAWDKFNEPGFGYDWALEADGKMKQFILEGNHKALIDYRSQGKAFDLAVPTAEHFLPLLYILGLKKDHEQIEFFNDQAVAGSLTMTSLKIGGN
jgi:4,5-DOPA dioxygenase extradiol